MQKLLLLFIAFAALPLSAESITYQVQDYGTYFFSLVSPDFLPTLYPGKTAFLFDNQDLSSIGGCSAPTYCYGASFQITPDSTIARMRYQDGNDSYMLIEDRFLGADLAHTGTFVDVANHGVLTISSDSLSPTAAPEPCTWAMFAIGIGLVSVKCSRRLFHSAVDPKEVVCTTV